MKKSKPNNSLNFFVNYRNHISCVVEDLSSKVEHLSPNVGHLSSNAGLLNAVRAIPNVGKLARPLMVEGLKCTELWTPFHDRYDITDEVLNATFAWLMIENCAGAMLCLAMYEAGCMLAVRGGFMIDEDEAHGDQAIENLITATALYFYSYVYFSKSITTLATRWLVTALHGFNDSEKDRFEEGIEPSNNNL